MKIDPVDSPIGRSTGTRKLPAAVAGRAVAKPNNVGRCCLAAPNSVARNRLALGGAEVFRSRAGIR